MFRGTYADRIEKKAARGHAGFPVATIAFYGPDDTRASKLVFMALASDEEDSERLVERKWFSDTEDLRYSGRLAREVLELIEQYGCRSVAMPDRIIGCPHEAEKDYPAGDYCPQCPFWKGRDRFAGISIHGRPS